IFRRGKWDLPKGKLDKGETLDQCALREVSEETGLQNIQLQEFLMATYHTYHENGHFILKESHWYNMTTSDKQKLVPQTAEEISEARWVQPSAINELLNNTFPSVQDVLVAAGKTTL
ncbi:MAG: NUDIX domain-containing protein, partial [Bacteroidota bacterium]